MTASATRTTDSRRWAPVDLDAQLFTCHRALAQILGGRLEHDQPLLHDVAAVAHREGDAGVLLDEEHGHAEPLELADHVADVAGGGGGGGPGRARAPRGTRRAPAARARA